MQYKILGTTGVPLAQIALGTANFGGRWGHGADAAESAAIFNTYAEAGGNFESTHRIDQVQNLDR